MLSALQRLAWPVATLALCFAAELSAGDLAPDEKFEAKAARVVSVNGKVLVGDHELKVGDALHQGDTIRTAENASTKLLTSDRSVLDIGPSSVFRIGEFKEDESSTALTTEIEWGTVRASIRKHLEKKRKFHMHTKSSVLAVRGTEFVVQAQKNGMENVTVAEGKVDTSARVVAPRQPSQENDAEENNDEDEETPSAADAPRALTLVPGDQWEHPATGEAVVHKLTPEAVQTIVARATVQDQAFLQAVLLSGTVGRSRAIRPAPVIDATDDAVAPSLEFADPEWWRRWDALAGDAMKSPTIPNLSEWNPALTGGQSINLNVIFQR